MNRKDNINISVQNMILPIAQFCDYMVRDVLFAAVSFDA